MLHNRKGSHASEGGPDSHIKRRFLVCGPLHVQIIDWIRREVSMISVLGVPG
jgi:hypothetical protein